MNNPYIPNSASIPNILFDYWMEILTPAEFKVVMCIARKTYKKCSHIDLISLKEIEKMTNLSRSGIIKNINNLMKLGLISKIKIINSDGNDTANLYEINTCLGDSNE